jgi:hypothetical protein
MITRIWRLLEISIIIIVTIILAVFVQAYATKYVIDNGEVIDKTVVRGEVMNANIDSDSCTELDFFGLPLKSSNSSSLDFNEGEGEIVEYYKLNFEEESNSRVYIRGCLEKDTFIVTYVSVIIGD